MRNEFLILDTPWWIGLMAVIVAAMTTLLMYYGSKSPWSPRVNVALGLLRFLGITAILILMLNPLLKQVLNRTEKAKVVLALDNSESILATTDSTLVLSLTTSLEQVLNDLNTDGLETETYTLSGSLEESTPAYNQQATNLSALLGKISDDHEGKNLGAVVLVSDGIYNRGLSPSFRNTTIPTFTVGLGDTIPPRDASILEVQTNQVVYQGNKFPVKVLMSMIGYENIDVRIRHAGKIITRSNVSSKSPEANFAIESSKVGLTRYTVDVPVQPGESSTENNSYDFYVDVIDGKEKILILADAPHPDISAIRSVLANNENYETFLQIPGLGKTEETEFDVIVQFGAFGRRPAPSFPGNPAFLYVARPAFDPSQMQDVTGVLINQNARQTDNITPAFNPSFSSFQLDADNIFAFNTYPSLQVPFGEYSISGPVEVLLFQQVGSIVTKRPLLSFFNDGNIKNALLVSGGIWKWRLQEAALTNESQNFDDLILKTIQYLSIKADKRKFRFEPLNAVFYQGDDVKFSVEIYDNVYERVYGNSIKLQVTNEAGKSQSFDFVNNPGSGQLSIGKLDEGIYQYKATTVLGTTTSSVSGEFLVKKVQLENMNLTANHILLKEVAANSGAMFFLPDEVTQLKEAIDNLHLTGVIRSSELYFPLINSILILIIVVVLFSVEWFIRKYLGSY
ncbi:MAG: hypothetical protein KI790_12630 [Cyclobacteriaceae bacterium]|nr:hypothetical protein [Cyclobacteriaceae bacterium HetDA_MAG_MS6]